MKSVYTPPNSPLEFEKTEDPHKLVRPLAVTIIAFIFIFLGMVDLLFSLKKGLIYLSSSGSDTQNSTGIRIELLWLLLYGIGAGLMRRGKFARAMACVFGILMLILPGLILIYFLYFSPAKDYFNNKDCPSCQHQKWKNLSINFRKQKCKKCGHEVSLQKVS